KPDKSSRFQSDSSTRSPNTIGRFGQPAISDRSRNIGTGSPRFIRFHFVRNILSSRLPSIDQCDYWFIRALNYWVENSPVSDYQIENVTVSRVYYVEGLGHNLFSVGQFCDSDLELKFEKDHLCSACAMGKSTKKTHKPKSEETNQEKLYLLHMDLCGRMRVESINGKKYILVIVDDYSRFTWVKFLRSKDETPMFIIKFLKMIQVRLNVPVRRIRTDNGTEFVNQTLRDYYEEVGISHETSVARSP
nr:retrovirus-related Pol polyprotein from transposon TNT 1-94 [Tanacetum cinerariifolium]